jgi:hypothetical protein
MSLDRSIHPMENRPRLGTAVALVAAAATLAPFFILFLYAHPQNDDWVLAVSVESAGVLGATEGWLRSWSGRYSAIFLNLLTPLGARSLDGWRLANAAYALAVPLGTWAIVSVLSPRSSGRLDRLAVAAILAALLYAGMPNPASGLYWMNGSVCYGVGEGLALLTVACTLAAERVHGRVVWAVTTTAALLAAIAAGMNEAIALLLIGTLGVIFAVRLQRGSPAKAVALVLAVSLAGLATIWFMPGTQIRMAYAAPPGGRSLLPLLARTLEVAARNAAQWSDLTPLLPAALLLALTTTRARVREADWTLPHPGLVAPVALAAYIGTVFVPLYGSGDIPPHTLNLLHAVFVYGVLLTAACTGAWLAVRRPAAASLPTWVGLAACLAAAALAVIPESAGRTAWSDLLSGRASQYVHSMEERYRLIARCGPICVVPRIENPPRTIVWFEDAVDDARDGAFFLRYKDNSYARYFRKARIRLVPLEGP